MSSSRNMKKIDSGDLLLDYCCLCSATAKTEAMEIIICTRFCVSQDRHILDDIMVTVIKTKVTTSDLEKFS